MKTRISEILAAALCALALGCQQKKPEPRSEPPPSATTAAPKAEAAPPAAAGPPVRFVVPPPAVGEVVEVSDTRHINGTITVGSTAATMVQHLDVKYRQK